MHGTGSTASIRRQPQSESDEQNRANPYSTRQESTTKENDTNTGERTSEETDESDPTFRRECPECSGEIINDEAHAERVCNKCGLVIKSTEIDRGPQWRHSDGGGGTERRVGKPSTPLMHDRGLSTKISWKNKDADGNPIGTKRRVQMNRLRKQDEWSRASDGKETTLKKAFSEIQRMGSALSIELDVREMASVIFRRMSEEDLLHSRSIESVATASLYAASRQADIPRTPSEFAAVSRVEKIKIERTYRFIVRELEIGIEATAAESYVPQFTSTIEFTNREEVEALSQELLEAGRDKNLHSGRSPSSLAGAAIYAASLVLNEGATQDEVADAADTSSMTIRSHYQELLEAGSLIEPNTE